MQRLYPTGVSHSSTFLDVLIVDYTLSGKMAMDVHLGQIDPVSGILWLSNSTEFISTFPRPYRDKTLGNSSFVHKII